MGGCSRMEWPAIEISAYLGRKVFQRQQQIAAAEREAEYFGPVDGGRACQKQWEALVEQIKAARQQQALEMEMLKEKASAELPPPRDRAEACLKCQVSEAEDARKNQQALVRSAQWEPFSSGSERLLDSGLGYRLHHNPNLFVRFVNTPWPSLASVTAKAELERLKEEAWHYPARTSPAVQRTTRNTISVHTASLGSFWSNLNVGRMEAELIVYDADSGERQRAKVTRGSVYQDTCRHCASC